VPGGARSHPRLGLRNLAQITAAKQPEKCKALLKNHSVETGSLCGSRCFFWPEQAPRTWSLRARAGAGRVPAGRAAARAGQGTASSSAAVRKNPGGLLRLLRAGRVLLPVRFLRAFARFCATGHTPANVCAVLLRGSCRKEVYFRRPVQCVLAAVSLGWILPSAALE